MKIQKHQNVIQWKCLLVMGCQGPLMQEIVNRLNKGEITPPISGTDTIKTVSLVHALYASDETQSWYL